MQAQLDADPEFASLYESEAHFDRYIECVYEVRLRHEPEQRYQWRREVNNLTRDHTEAVCNGLAPSVAASIITSTKECTDLDAGAYWGHVLEPLR